MERQVIDSIHEVLDKFHISYDEYERYMDNQYTFNLKEKDLFVDVFLEIPDKMTTLDREKKLMTGSFYTPPEVASLIVKKTLKYFEGDHTEAEILDLSVGTGNLMMAYLDLLNLDDDQSKFRAVSRLYACDIQWEPLIVYVNRLLMLFDDFPSDLSINVYHEDSLQIDLEQKFDIILGNPPYIGEKGNKELFRSLKITPFGKKYYESKMDYHYYFLYKGFEMLKTNGVMGTITTNYHFTADGAVKLREYIKKFISYREIVNFSEQNLFKEALGQHNVITITQLKKVDGEVIIQNFGDEFTVREDQLYSNSGYIQIYTGIEDYEILDKIKRCATFLLGDFFEIHQGIVSGADYLSRKKSEMLSDESIQPGDGIFILTDEEIDKNGLKDSLYLRKFYKNSDIDHYEIMGKSEKHILYVDDRAELSQADPEYRHLYRFRPLLEMRREVINGNRNWYALQWPRVEDIFRVEKIVVPHRNLQNRFALSLDSFYASADVYYIVSRSTVFDLKVICAILNSKLMYYWLFNMGKKKGKMLELYSTPLKQIPICYSQNTRLIQLVEDYLESENNQVLDAIDQVVYENYQLTQQERDEVESFHRRMGTEQKNTL
jgi:adenine-specific DNA-methyltransferase